MCNENVSEYSGRKADIWSLGVCLYSMTYNVLPFDSENEMEIFLKILKEPVVFGERQVSEGLKSLIMRMLEKEPAQRITIDEMKTLAWLNEGYQVSLADQGAAIFANLSDQELRVHGVSSKELQMAL